MMGEIFTVGDFLLTWDLTYYDPKTENYISSSIILNSMSFNLKNVWIQHITLSMDDVTPP